MTGFITGQNVVHDQQLIDMRQVVFTLITGHNLATRHIAIGENKTWCNWRKNVHSTIVQH